MNPPNEEPTTTPTTNEAVEARNDNEDDVAMDAPAVDSTDPPVEEPVMMDSEPIPAPVPITEADATTPPTTTTTQTDLISAATHESQAITQSLLLADHETAHQTLLAQHDALTLQHQSSQDTVAKLTKSIHELKEQLTKQEQMVNDAKLQKTVEEQRANECRVVEGEVKERLARVEVENDGLRQEIRYVASRFCYTLV